MIITAASLLGGRSTWLLCSFEQGHNSMCTLCFLCEMWKKRFIGEAVRDLLHFLVHDLPSEITDELPIHVPRIPCRQCQARYSQGFKSRLAIPSEEEYCG